MSLSIRAFCLCMAMTAFACNKTDEGRIQTLETSPPPGAEVATEPDAEQGDQSAQPTRRFLVLAKLGQTQEQVAVTATREFGADAVTEALFSGVDDEELSRTYIVTAPESEEVANPWDSVYALAAAGDFEKVELERQDTLVPPFTGSSAAAACASDSEPENPDTAWALKKINAEAAWALVPPGDGKKFGDGVSICHPDTGWTEHDDLDTLDLSRARNVIDDNDDARDPHITGVLMNPGHGTATGSVIASDGGIASDSGTTGPGKITGVAPSATIVPIRTVKSVVQVFDSDVAKAVTHAVAANCDVISMSLGGRGFFGLKRAVKYANNNGLIVVAAAGNCVGSIVAPASYNGTIAAAATNDQDKPWKGSSRGKKITISAPGQNIWSANAESASDLPAQIKRSDGTSFATAEIAGAAAVWLAFHTRDEIEQAAGGKRISDLFVRILQKSARVPPDWNSNKLGAGILDLEAMLQEDIHGQGPSLASSVRTPGQEAVELLSATIDRDPAEVSRALELLLDSPSDFDASVTRWMPELLDVAMRNPDEFHHALDQALAPSAPIGGPARVQARSALEPLMSDTLGSAMQ